MTAPRGSDHDTVPGRLRVLYPDAPRVLLAAVAARVWLVHALRLEHAARLECDEAIRSLVTSGDEAPYAAAVVAELARVSLKGASMLREDATILYARRLEALAAARARVGDRPLYVLPVDRGDAWEAPDRDPSPPPWLLRSRETLRVWSRSYRVARETFRET